MDKSRFFGFWKEYSGNGFPSLLDQPTNVLDDEEAEKVANYLNRCPMWVASPGHVKSTYSDEVAGSLSIRTDGKWAWQDTTAYFVKKYKIGLPSTFLEYLREKNFTLDESENIDIYNLEFPESLI